MKERNWGTTEEKEKDTLKKDSVEWEREDKMKIDFDGCARGGAKGADGAQSFVYLFSS